MNTVPFFKKIQPTWPTGKRTCVLSNQQKKWPNLTVFLLGCLWAECTVCICRRSARDGWKGVLDARKLRKRVAEGGPRGWNLACGLRICAALSQASMKLPSESSGSEAKTGRRCTGWFCSTCWVERGRKEVTVLVVVAKHRCGRFGVFGLAGDLSATPASAFQRSRVSPL